MLYEAKKQSMAKGSLKTYALTMEETMAAGAFGRATNYG